MIYLITHFDQLPFDALCLKLESLLPLGIDYVQYRHKHASRPTKCHQIAVLQSLLSGYSTKLIINDDLALAIETKSDGVHVGQNDISARDIRTRYHYRGIVGVTAKSVEQAMRAQMDGASYLGVGALFPSKTKPDALGIDLFTLEKIRRSTTIDIFGIGGIEPSILSPKLCSSLDGVAVSHAIWHSSKPEKQIKDLKAFFKASVNSTSYRV